jgi:alpha-galactosidase
MQDGLRQYAGPGAWNDPDMMEVGNGLSQTEDISHFSLWAMLSAPLIAGNDLRKMRPETIEILTNKDVIAVNQDALGVQAFKHKVEGDLEYWYKPLEDKSWAVLVLNRGEKAKEITINWKAEQVEDAIFPLEGPKYKANFKNSRYTILDLWSKKELGTTKRKTKMKVDAHGVVMLRLDKIIKQKTH